MMITFLLLRTPRRIPWTKIACNHLGIKQVQSRTRFYAPGRLVLVDGPTLADTVVHQGLESAFLQHPYLQRPHRLIVRAAPPVYVVQRFLHCNAALLKELMILECRHCCYRRARNLPEQYVVAWYGCCIGVAGVLYEEEIVWFQELLGVGDALVEVFLVGLFAVDAEDDAPSAYESELWGPLVESNGLKHVSNAVSVQPCAAPSSSPFLVSWNLWWAHLH